LVNEKFKPTKLRGIIVTISNCSKGLAIKEINIQLIYHYLFSEEEGLEPSTLGFENQCSNQLSYSSGSMLKIHKDYMVKKSSVRKRRKSVF
jgi:hypothetical protein